MSPLFTLLIADANKREEKSGRERESERERVNERAKESG